MPASLGEQILERISDAEKQYARLVPVVGPPGTGKTKALRPLAEENGYRFYDRARQAAVYLGRPAYVNPVWPYKISSILPIRVMNRIMSSSRAKSNSPHGRLSLAHATRMRTPFYRKRTVWAITNARGI
jgi:hypothetical protein